MGSLISPEYLEMNRQLHATGAYGINGHKRVEDVMHLALQIDAKTILDYGCGRGTLKKNLTLPVREYDIAIPGKDSPPSPADLVVCGDVLEHVEPEYLENVIEHLKSLTRKLLYVVVHIGPAKKVLADGRNAHLIQESPEWWIDLLGKHFNIDQSQVHVKDGRGEVALVLYPKHG